MSDREGKKWGSIFKSNSNGTYYNVALEYVNRDRRGYTDFEKMIGLDGIAVVNIVANPDDAAISGKKELQTRITHNDGSTWKPLTPPARDSLNQPYDCQDTVSRRVGPSESDNAGADFAITVLRSPYPRLHRAT